MKRAQKSMFAYLINMQITIKCDWSYLLFNSHQEANLMFYIALWLWFFSFFLFFPFCISKCIMLVYSTNKQLGLSEALQWKPRCIQITMAGVMYCIVYRCVSKSLYLVPVFKSLTSQFTSIRVIVRFEFYTVVIFFSTAKGSS